MILASWLLAFGLVASPAPPPPKIVPFYDEGGTFVAHCYPEAEDVGPLLDTAWQTLQLTEKKVVKTPRPQFCFTPCPVRMVNSTTGEEGYLYGYSNLKRNRLLLAFVPDSAEMECNAIHEMLHFLFGPSHKDFPAKMAAAGCGGK